MHGVGQRHYPRYPGHQPVRVAGQSRVLRSPREQRKASMIMEIVVAKGDGIVAQELALVTSKIHR